MSALSPMAMPYAGRAVPHVVIEVNQAAVEIRARPDLKLRRRTGGLAVWHGLAMPPRALPGRGR